MRVKSALKVREDKLKEKEKALKEKEKVLKEKEKTSNSQEKNTSVSKKMHIQDLPSDIQAYILTLVPNGESRYLYRVNKTLNSFNKHLHSTRTCSDRFVSTFYREVTILQREYPNITDKNSYLIEFRKITDNLKNLSDMYLGSMQTTMNTGVYNLYRSIKSRFFDWAPNFLNTSTRNGCPIMDGFMFGVKKNNAFASECFMDLCCKYIKITLLYLSINRDDTSTWNIIDLLLELYDIKMRMQWVDRTIISIQQSPITNYILFEFQKINVISLKILDLSLNHSPSDVIWSMQQLSYMRYIYDNFTNKFNLSKMQTDSSMFVESLMYIATYLHKLHFNNIRSHPDYIKFEQGEDYEYIINPSDFIKDESKFKKCVEYIKQKNEFIDDNAHFTFL